MHTKNVDLIIHTLTSGVGFERSDIENVQLSIFLLSKAC